MSKDDDDFSRPTLPVANTPSTENDENGLPKTGEDYLRLVRNEAKKRPQIVSARLDRSKRRLMDAQSTTCPSWKFAIRSSHPASSVAMASEMADSGHDTKWKDQFMNRFVALRLKFQTHKRCQKDQQQTQHQIALNIVSESEWKKRLFDSHDGVPSLQLALPYMHQGIVLDLLRYHELWLRKATDKNIQEQTARTIFALLVALDPLLTADETAILRRLCRQLVSLRQKQESRTDQSVWLHLLITIIARFFSQQDFEHY